MRFDDETLTEDGATGGPAVEEGPDQEQQCKEELFVFAVADREGGGWGGGLVCFLLTIGETRDNILRMSCLFVFAVRGRGLRGREVWFVSRVPVVD